MKRKIIGERTKQAITVVLFIQGFIIDLEVIKQNLRDQEGKRSFVFVRNMGFLLNGVEK
ncbi:hypothetical protein GK2007 [Geobacillus kaustophilus HTA426]|uniref:Uncharacterized protein n=1 Tax=Geobacillus kaustophilus (strain HTA426) TaxID=235909 RepID=Q5KYE4_GEOKA|nr:hypothetical protein GK2007 [Geobacillus kaustophilus HTA426]